RDVPVEVEAVGIPSLGQKLLCSRRVVRRYRQLGPIATQGITGLVADPVAPRLADTLGLLLDDEGSVDRQADGLAHALVVERTGRLVRAGQYEVRGRGVFGFPPQLRTRHAPLQELARHPVGEVELAGLETGHAGGQIPDGPDVDGLHTGRSPPVLIPGLDRDLHTRFL